MRQALRQLLEAENEIVQMMESLPAHHCTAFGAACCERLAPNYQVFSVVHNWGDSSILQRSLNIIWEYLNGKPLASNEVETWIESLEAIVPDLNEYHSIFVEQAMYAVDAVISTLRYCITEDKDHVKNVVSISLVATETYLRDVGLPYTYSIPQNKVDFFDEWVWNSPLIMNELENQRRELKALKAESTLTTDFLRRLRQTAQSSGINLVKRGVVVGHSFGFES